MNDLIELMRNRYSVRSFLPDPVADDVVEKIISAGLAAPTAHNNQPQKIIAVKSGEGLEKLRKCTECHYGAPLAFIVCYDSSLCWKRSYDGKTSGDVDASIVATHMMLEAEALGVGSTWVMYFIPEAAKTEFELPEGIEPAAILVMGTPSAGAKPAPAHFSNRNRDEIVSYR